MKKSVILLIFVIYVASVVIIGFFGVKIASYEPFVYVSKIEILNPEVKTSTEGNKFISFYFDENDEDNNIIQLRVKMLPENATINTPAFLYSNNDNVLVDLFGNVQFLKPTTVTIYIKSQDGANITETITLIARKPIWNLSNKGEVKYEI